MRGLLFPLLIGLGGTVVLVGLGVWQLQRLEWKEAILAEMSASLTAAPVALPAQPSAQEDQRRAVRLSATPTGEELHVLASGTSAGTGYRVISAVETAEGRRVMVDQGLLPLEAKDAPPATAPMEITGNLLWPDDRTSSTPAPDPDRNIWFARDVASMADALGTEPVLVVLREASPADPRLTPLPLDTADVRNDHLAYAVTWFGLALAWLGMTAYFLRRRARPTS